MSPKRVAGALAAVGTAALIAIAWFAVPAVIHHNRDRALRRALDLVPGTLLHARNFHWTQMKGDRQQWELNADEAAYSNDKTLLNLRQPELTMVLDDGKTLVLHAASAKLKLTGNHIKEALLTGGLELTYGDLWFATGEATFWPDADTIQAPGPVHVRSPGFDVTGVGMEAHPRARLFALQHQVRTEIKREASGAGSKKS